MADGPTLSDLLKEAMGGIGSDARMPVGPAIRPMASNPAYTLGGKRMEGQRPLTDTELNMPRAAAELTGIPQAASAIGEAYQDPSIPTVFNAGARTALAAGRPLGAAGILGTGYLSALLKDAGAFDGPSEAEAQTAKPSTRLEGLSDQQQALWDTTQNKIARGRYKNDEELEQLKMTLQDLRDISKEFSKTQNAERVKLGGQAASQKQDEYDRAVRASEAAFAHEMSRDRRFSDTDTGKLYDRTGGVAPWIAGGAFGLGSRLATGGGETTLGSALKNYALPAILGGAAGMGAYNAPLAYNTFATEPDNPKKRAYEARGEALTPDNPRKQEFLDYAKSLPERNQVQETAEKAFYDGLVKRSIVGALEGAGGGLGGADVVRSFSRGGGVLSGLGSWLKSLGGRGDSQLPRATIPGTVVDTPPGAVSSSPRPTAGSTSSETILPPKPRIAEMLRSPDPVPQLSGPSNRQSSLPSWASEPPEGIKLRPGYLWDTATQQPRHLGGKFGDKPKYSAPKAKKEAPKGDEPTPEKPSVQIDDTKPLRYED